MSSQGNYYNSMSEIPIWNWWKISETGDLKYIFKTEKVDTSIVSTIKEVFDFMQDEYFERYGLDSELKKLLSFKKEWIKQRTKWVLNKDRHAKMLSEMAQIDMNDLRNLTVKKTRKEDTIIMLEEKLGRELEPKKLVSIKYFDYVHYYKDK